MAESTDIHDWELLQNSDTDDNSMPFEEIIHADYFSVDRFRPFPNSPQIELRLEETFVLGENSENFRSESDKGDSFLLGHREVETGVEGIDPGLHIPDEGDSFPFDGLKLEVGFPGIEPGMKNIDGIHAESEKGDTCVATGANLKLDLEAIDQDHLISGAAGDHEELGFGVAEGSAIDELGSDSNIELSDSECVSVHNGDKKGMVWWKQSVEILKLFVSRMKPLWSIPIAAAVIGVVMMSRRLYRMKQKSRRIPLKVSFEDKKATAKFLVSAARLNEALVRRVPVIRSPLLPANGVTPWPVVGLL